MHMHTPTGYTPGPHIPDFEARHLAVWAFGIGAIICVVALWTFSVIVAMAMVGYTVLAGLLYWRATKNNQAIRGPNTVSALLFLSALTGLLSCLLVFAWHWLPLNVAEWIVTILYISALGFGLLRSLSKLLQILAVLLAVGMVTATIMLPVPRGGEDKGDKDNDWSVRVTVNDQNGTPLEGAVVQCTVLMKWLGQHPLDEIALRKTDDAGRTDAWEYTEDRRLKTVLCTALKRSNSGNSGYPLNTGVLLALHKGENDLTITLTETAHPDSAYLTVKLYASPPYPWYSLQFELWGEPPLGEFHSSGRYSGAGAPIASKSWQDLQDGGFTITRHDARKKLYLRYFYERPAGEGNPLLPPTVTVATVPLGKVKLGSRTVKAITLP